ncbi:17536_t:CDS:2 [Funneliformis geosporum]|uniref:3888_t:CDS:1 n=1 Tax=Funneliformis geosporum TaxID=1117311 RepID=A0A9W4SH31_9GLOM|nr:17536_t:CDS:2 [Funneliformis geosporum]CAI2168288.1 3888_t:CDS:2 [Funneliformis geosporum]
MNTPGSMIIGWVALLAAGGGAYYYAKKDIDARRRAQELAKTRPTEKLEWWQRIEQENNTGEKSSTPNTGQNPTNTSSSGT